MGDLVVRHALHDAGACQVVHVLEAAFGQTRSGSQYEGLIELKVIGKS